MDERLRSSKAEAIAATGFSYLAVHAFPVPEQELLYPTIGVACRVAGTVLLGVSPMPAPRETDADVG